jgi:hypothetical protein
MLSSSKSVCQSLFLPFKGVFMKKPNLLTIGAGFALLLFSGCATQELALDEAELQLETLRNTTTAGVMAKLVSGNPTCASLGYSYGFKPSAGGVENRPGTYTDSNNVTVTWAYVPKSNSLLTWSASRPIDAVIVKGGSSANVYKYTSPVLRDGNLATPKNRGCQPAAVSHVQFCYNTPPENP